MEEYEIILSSPTGGSLEIEITRREKETNASFLDDTPLTVLEERIEKEAEKIVEDINATEELKEHIADLTESEVFLNE